MNNLILFFLSLIGLIAQSQNTTISGKISNNFAEKVIIESADGDRSEIKIESTNEFKASILIKEGIYKMTIGNEYTNIYLKPNASLQFTIDLNQFDQSVSYSGDLANENNALAKLMTQNQDFQGKYVAHYKLSEDSFIRELNSYLSTKKDILKNTAIGEKFKQTELKKVAMEYYLYLFDYPSNHKRFNKLKIFKPSSSFYSFVSEIDLEDEEAFEGNNIYLLDNYIFYQANKDSDTAIYLNEVENITALKKWVKNRTLRNKYIKESYKNDIVYFDNTSILVDTILSAITDPKLADEIKLFANQFKKLKKGNSAPAFKLHNEKGEFKSLSDYKGNYVYLDVWATWCGPCRVELPYYDSLKTEYKNKNIKFVSICVWDDEAKWKSFLKDKKMSGEQLFIAGQESQFVLDYMIRGVPSFILIDKNGEIMERKAFRPSDNSARERLNELLQN